MAKADEKSRPSKPLMDDDDDPIDDDLLLDEVVLKSLTVSPGVVRPFGSATLRWRVDAPEGVHLQLDGVSSAFSGRRIVRPEKTHTYRLLAFTRRNSRRLGEIVVNVALDQCITRNSSLIEELLSGGFMEAVKGTQVYFRSIIVTGPNGSATSALIRPEVTISPGRISFRLRLKADVDYFPDPDVDIEGSFGLAVAFVQPPGQSTVTGTEVVPANINVRADVSFPLWVYALPPGPFIAIATSMAEDKAKAIVIAGVRKFVRDLLNWPPPAGMLKLACASMSTISGVESSNSNSARLPRPA